jgi:histidinol-phosphate/aromatic aminotransferase/cobyric acid decarboxylase-like protein/choline kinase
MKAIILAAGYAKRMRPLTNNTHKTLLNVGSVPVINRIVDGLIENNIVDIVVGTGYMAEELKLHLKNTYPSLNFTFVFNDRYQETNNIYSLAQIFSTIEIDDDILLIESDLIYEPAVLNRILSSKEKTVALVDHYKTGMDGTVVTISNEIITSIIPPHLQGEDFSFKNKYKTLNIYKFSKEFCNLTFSNLLQYYAKIIDDNCYYELILGILIYVQKEQIHAEILDGEKWAEIDDPNDLNIADYIFSDEKVTNLERSFGGYWNFELTDFYFIRNMYFPNNSMISEIKNNLEKLIFNYGSKQSVLNKKLSYLVECSEDNIILLNGASQVYPILQDYFRNEKALIPWPTFGEYERIFPSAEIYHDNFSIDLNEFEDKIKSTNIAVIVNPNNPTGTTLSTNEIYRLAKKHASVFFLVDESFIEFSNEKSIILNLKEHGLDNVLVIKSLSKNLGVPGIRLGYAFSTNKEILNYISARIPIWNSNSIAEFYLEIILKHKNDLLDSYKKTKEDRAIFAENLSQISFVEKVFTSGGNYITIKLKEKPKADIPSVLINNYGVLVKDVSGKLNDNNYYLRLAVRLPEENQMLVELLENELSNVQKK